MSDQIDILQAAALGLHNAKEALRSTMYMQTSPNAEFAYQTAVLRLHEAQTDMDAAQRVAAELAENENVIAPF